VTPDRVTTKPNKGKTMKRISIIGLCLMAVFALSAMVASSASAAQKNLLW